VRIIPHEPKFFELFAKLSDRLAEAARYLLESMNGNVAVQTENLKELEHQADELTHEIITKLNQSFITPFDREDIHRLAAALDDVVDFIYAAGERIAMFRITVVPRDAHALAKVILAQAEHIQNAVAELAKGGAMVAHRLEINRLEKEGDRLKHRAIAELFEREKDAIAVIKLKELYEVLAIATDKADEVANVLESIALKNA
jgi:uncharacterized protein